MDLVISYVEINTNADMETSSYTFVIQVQVAMHYFKMLYVCV